MSARQYFLTHSFVGIAFGCLAAWLETGSVIEYVIWVVPVLVTVGVSCVAAVVYSLLRRTMNDAVSAWAVAAVTLVGVSLLCLWATEGVGD